MRKAVFLTAIITAAQAAAVNYTLEISTSREIDASAGDFARGFGIPDISRTDTTVSFSLEPVGGTAAYRLTFITATQKTLVGEAVLSDIEKVGGLLPGRWLEFLPETLAAGGVKRSPELTKDSEEISYNLLTIMFFPPGSPLADAWKGPATAAIARSWGVGIVGMEKASAQALEAFEGETTALLEYTVTVKQDLTQDTNVSQMKGAVVMEGAGASVAGDDGLPLYGRLDITGTRDRSFVIFGKQHQIKDEITSGLRLLREGQQFPADWTAEEEIKAN